MLVTDQVVRDPDAVPTDRLTRGVEELDLTPFYGPDVADDEPMDGGTEDYDEAQNEPETERKGIGHAVGVSAVSGAVGLAVGSGLAYAAISSGEATGVLPEGTTESTVNTLVAAANGAVEWTLANGQLLVTTLGHRAVEFAATPPGYFAEGTITGAILMFVMPRVIRAYQRWYKEGYDSPNTNWHL